MFTLFRTQGFIFKKEDRGEADQLFTIYTKDFGKLEILGKAIRKISSKLRSGMEIFYLSEIEFIQGKIYKTLTDALKIEKFQNLSDLEKLDIAYKIADDLDNFVKGEESDEEIWQLLLEVFQKLNNYQLPTTNYQLLYYYFFWNFISALGYEPELHYCSVCQKKLRPEKLYFRSKEGGIICYNCFKEKESISAKEISSEIVKIIRILLKKNWQILVRLKIEKKHLESLGEISQNYSNVILGKNLPC